MEALPLALAVAEIQEKGAEAFARSFFLDSRVKKIVGRVMVTSGLPFDFRDDLFQETFSIVSEYASSGRITNPEGVYSFVYATAFNSARTIRHLETKNGANILTGADDGGERREHEIVDESTSTDHGESVDIVRARNKIASILKDKKRDPMQTHPLVSNAKPAVRAVDADKGKGRASTRKLSPEQQELADIIEELGYKHDEFAGEICIGMSRLASYLYGRTITVPNDIMRRARELKQQASPVVERWKKAYDKPMPTIIAGWEVALGLEPSAKGNDEIIARVLEVNPVTVYRWRKQDTTPQMHSIAKMDGRIRSEVARIARRQSAKSKASA